MDAAEPRRRGAGLTLKVFAATAAVVVAVIASSLVITASVARSTAEHALDQQLATTGEVMRQAIEAEHARLAAGAAAAVENPSFVAAVADTSPQGLFAVIGDRAGEIRRILGASYALVADGQGILKWRTDRPGESGDTLRVPLLRGALEGRQVAGYIGQADQRLFLAVATPLLLGEVPLGVLLVAAQVTDSVAVRLQRSTGSHVVFYILDPQDRPIVVAASLPRSEALDSAVRGTVRSEMLSAGSAEMRAVAEVSGARLVGLNRTLVNPGLDRPMGGYLALRPLGAERATFERLQRALVVVGMVGLLLALAASWLVARRIAGRVRVLGAAMERVAEGDYGADVPARARDEIGQLAGSFRHMLDELRSKQQLVELLSGSAGAATQSIDTAGGDAPVPTMVRSSAAGTGMLAVGQTFAGRYEVKAVLGMSGSGAVYRAMDRGLGEAVAIRTLRADAVVSDPATLQRFRDEIRLARTITHRNVVGIRDLGEVEGMFYLTMEYVAGESLEHLLQVRGRLPVSVVLTVGQQLCRALEVAHERGVVHRDIKPQNLIVDPSGTVKVMGFGAARLAGRTDGIPEAGIATGTPEYMAPEYLLGDLVDVRADLYAAGCVLFECLTGRPPFVADSPIDVVAKQLEEAPASPASLNAEVPAPLAELVLRTLSKDRTHRPASARVLHDELDAIAVWTRRGVVT